MPDQYRAARPLDDGRDQHPPRAGSGRPARANSARRCPRQWKGTLGQAASRLGPARHQRARARARRPGGNTRRTGTRRRRRCRDSLGCPGGGRDDKRRDGGRRVMEPCRILLIDDHAVVRAGCRVMLQLRAVIEIIEAGSAAEGVRLNAEHRPQLIVLDLGLGDGSGFDIMQRLRADGRAAPILVFTMHEDPVMAARAMKSGAAGYASKNDGPDTFLDAVDTLLRGDIYLSPAMAQKLAPRQIRPGDNPRRSLSRPELDALRLFGAGKNLAEI